MRFAVLRVVENSEVLENAQLSCENVDSCRETGGNCYTRIRQKYQKIKIPWAKSSLLSTKGNQKDTTQMQFVLKFFFVHKMSLGVSCAKTLFFGFMNFKKFPKYSGCQ